MPLSLVPELSRLENSGGTQAHDLDMARKVDALSKIVLSSSAQVWLVNLAQFAVTKVLTVMEEGAGLDEVERTFKESLCNTRLVSPILTYICGLEFILNYSKC
jgi:hypothetical protein